MKKYNFRFTKWIDGKSIDKFYSIELQKESDAFRDKEFYSLFHWCDSYACINN